MRAMTPRGPCGPFFAWRRLPCRELATRTDLASKMMQDMKEAREKMIVDVMNPKGPKFAKASKASKAFSARLRWGRGSFGSAERKEVAQREASEMQISRRVKRSIDNSPMGLYPVYDLPRHIGLHFVGTKVLQPSSLRFALAQASEEVKWAASGDGRSRFGKEDEEPELIESEEDEE